MIAIYWLVTKEQRIYLHNFSDHVYLSPDMAHQLYGTMEIKQGTTGEQLYFLRKDIEASDVEKKYLSATAR